MDWYANLAPQTNPNFLPLKNYFLSFHQNTVSVAYLYIGLKQTESNLVIF